MAAFGKISALAMLLLASLLAVTCAPGAQAAVPNIIKVVDNVGVTDLYINDLAVILNGKPLQVNLVLEPNHLLTIRIKVVVNGVVKLYEVKGLVQQLLGGLLNAVGALLEAILSYDGNCEGISVTLKVGGVVGPVNLCALQVPL